MADEKQKQTNPVTREPTWWVDLRGQWKAEPLTDTWQHPLLTAVAVVACLLLANLLHLKEPYWAAISAVVVMQTEWKPTVSAARDRLLGTIVGAAIGWLASLIWRGNVLVFGLALAISLTLCGVLGLKSAKRLAGTTMCLVTLVPAVGPKWGIALDRFVAVSFGVIIAVGVSLLLHRWVKLRS